MILDKWKRRRSPGPTNDMLHAPAMTEAISSISMTNAEEMEKTKRLKSRRVEDEELVSYAGWWERWSGM